MQEALERTRGESLPFRADSDLQGIRDILTNHHRAGNLTYYPSFTIRLWFQSFFEEEIRAWYLHRELIL